MSGPNDSGTGDAPTGDLKFPSLAAAAPEPVSPRFRLGINWSTPHLEWRPVMATPAPPRLGFLRLDDPFAAVEATSRYILNGAFLFDLQRPDWDDVDKALLQAPTEPPNLFPSFAQMKIWQNDAFFRGLAAPQPWLQAPAVAAPPTPFYKAPDPSAMRADSSAPRAGKVGDILKAVDGLPVVQELKNRAADQARLIVPRLALEWRSLTVAEKIPLITLSVPLVAGVVGTMIGPAETRHFLFQKLEGAKLPVPYVPGTKFFIEGFGKWSDFLIGAPANPRQPRELRFGVTVDLLEAIPAVRKAF
jgi:hypothetical protein